jgi:hypothetical protein
LLRRKEHKDVKLVLFRWAWFILFVIQIIWYYQSYKHLAAIVEPSGGLPNGTLTNLIAIDILGGMCWASVLLLTEELVRPGTLAKLSTQAKREEPAIQAKLPRWLYYVGIALCTLVAIAVTYANTHA